VGGQPVEVDEQGYLKNTADWSEELAKALAADVRSLTR
jgi:sulfur relay (sulfurtransferase) DsrC/TusE family protein